MLKVVLLVAVVLFAVSAVVSVAAPPDRELSVMFTKPARTSPTGPEVFVTATGPVTLVFRASDESGIARAKLMKDISATLATWGPAGKNASFAYTVDPKTWGFVPGYNYCFSAWATSQDGQTRAALINVRWTAI